MRRIAIGIVASCVALLILTGHHGDITDNARVPTATITTTNVPDGRCHEDDPCFVVCWVEPNPDTIEGVELLRGPHRLQPTRSITVPCPGPGWRDPIKEAHG